VTTDPPKLGEADEEVYAELLGAVDDHASEHWLRARLQERAQQLVCAKGRGDASLGVARAAGIDSPELLAQYMETLRAGKDTTDAELIRTLSALREALRRDEAEAANGLGRLRLREGGGQGDARDSACRRASTLAMLPGSSPLGALSGIAGCLFHTCPQVRALSASILRGLESSKDTAALVAGLNPFLLAALSAQPEP
jgi:hypothetical protein